MEYKNIYLALIGVFGFLVWTLEYWKIFKKTQIVVPRSFQKGRRLPLRIIIYLIGLLAWGALAISLAGPRQAIGHAKNNIEVNDIFFVVDASGSMTATDFSPNRIEAAKQKIMDFVDLRPRDRIGIIIFGLKAFTLLPLSVDLKLIKQMVNEIKIGYSGVGRGTNIGDAIALAVARSLQSMAKNKIIVLLTDGVSHAGSITPLEAAKQSKEQGIKIYTIAIAGSKDAKMPVTTPRGLTVMRSIPGGSVDTKTMQEIASITGGRSYVAADSSALKDVLMEIEKLERTKVETSSRIIYQEFFWIYLLVGALGLLLTELSRRFIAREGI